MKETRKKIIGVWLIVIAPLLLTLVLAGLKIIAWKGMPWFVAALPALVGYGIPLSAMLTLRIMAARERKLRQRTCCGNCVHCLENVYSKKGRCLAENIEINPRIHACSRFFGCVTKGYIPKEKIHRRDK